MSLADPQIELLILDFAGVCTPAPNELLDASPTGPVPIRPGIIDLVSSASGRGVIVVVLSNEISTEWVLDEDLFGSVDHVVSCADNKIWKPDRRAFQRCLLLTGKRAEQTLVVDDEDDNIVVARSIGMHALHFDVGDPESSVDELRRALA